MIQQVNLPSRHVIKSNSRSSLFCILPTRNAKRATRAVVVAATGSGDWIGFFLHIDVPLDQRLKLNLIMIYDVALWDILSFFLTKNQISSQI